jgi:hypothetical protein
MAEAFRPSNGTEGECFIGQWCAVCRHDRASRDPEADMAGGCDILARTMAFGVDHPDYPTEWIYGDDNRPKCTAFLWDDAEEIQPLDPNAVVRDLFAGMAA